MPEADRLEAERDRHDPEVQAVPAREFAETADAEPARGRALSRTAGRVLPALVGLLLVVALLWIAGDLHYQSCIQAAQARTPAPSASQGSLPPKLNNALDRSLGRTPTQNREEAVKGCSRLPF